MILSITTISHNAECHHDGCGILLIVMLSVNLTANLRDTNAISPSFCMFGQTLFMKLKCDLNHEPKIGQLVEQELILSCSFRCDQIQKVIILNLFTFFVVFK